MAVVRQAYESAGEGDRIKAAQAAIVMTPEFNTLHQDAEDVVASSASTRLEELQRCASPPYSTAVAST